MVARSLITSMLTGVILIALLAAALPMPALAYGGASGFVPAVFPILCRPFTIPVVNVTIQLCQADGVQINNSIQDRLSNFWQAVVEKRGLR